MQQWGGTMLTISLNRSQLRHIVGARAPPNSRKRQTYRGGSNNRSAIVYPIFRLRRSRLYHPYSGSRQFDCPVLRLRRHRPIRLSGNASVTQST